MTDRAAASTGTREVSTPAPASCALEVERAASRAGPITARVRMPGGDWRWLHSQHDPVEEARALVDGAGIGRRGAFLVLGLGLGYHVDEILKRTDRDAAVVVFDPYAAALDPNASLLRRYAEQGRYVVCFGGVDDFARFLHTQLWMLAQGGISVVEHPASVDLAPDAYAAARRAIRDGAIHGRLLTRTVYAFSDVWLANVAVNLPLIADDPGIEPLAGMWRGGTAIVVGAGPSLDGNADQLRAAKGRSIIIAAGSGYGALRRHGIEPDIVSVLDPAPLNRMEYQFEIPESTALLYEFKVTPSVARLFRGPRFAWTSSDPLSAWVERRLGPRTAAFGAGTVAYSGYALARHLGARRIVFAGLDLALTGGKSHAAGVVTKSPVDLRDPETIWVPGYHGEDVPTNRLFYSFLRTMEMAFAAADRDGIEIVDATEGGAAKRFSRRMPLREVVESLSGERVDVAARLAAAREAGRPDARARARLRRDLERLCRRMGDLHDRLVRAMGRIDELNRLTRAFELPNAPAARARLGERARETFRRVVEDNEKINGYRDVVDALGAGLHYLLRVDHGDPRELSIERKLELNSLFYAEMMGAVRTLHPYLQAALDELRAPAAAPDGTRGR